LIDTQNETLIRLADIPRLKWLPLRKSGCRLHLSTIYRWQQRGLNGIRLETVQVGGTRCTTEAALLRFFAALQDDESAASSIPISQSRLARAERVLDRAVIGATTKGGAIQ
jgi:hypothetical protein